MLAQNQSMVYLNVNKRKAQLIALMAVTDAELWDFQNISVLDMITCSDWFLRLKSDLSSAQ